MRYRQEQAERREQEDKKAAHLKLLKESSDYSPEDYKRCKEVEAAKKARSEFLSRPFKPHKVVILPKNEMPKVPPKVAQEGELAMNRSLNRKRRGVTYRKQGVHQSPDDAIGEAGGYEDEMLSAKIGTETAPLKFKRFLRRDDCPGTLIPNANDTPPPYAWINAQQRHEKGLNKHANLIKPHQDNTAYRKGGVEGGSRGGGGAGDAGSAGGARRGAGGDAESNKRRDKAYDDEDDPLDEELPLEKAITDAYKRKSEPWH